MNSISHERVLASMVAHYTLLANFVNAKYCGLEWIREKNAGDREIAASAAERMPFSEKL
jgi:hypothetical protein